MLVALVLASLGGCAAGANVTFFDWYNFAGRTHTESQDTADFQLYWRWTIQSIAIAPTDQLVTYDEPNFRGNKAVWRRSTPYPGNWGSRIASFQIRPLDVSALPSQSPIEAPWRIMGTWEGFQMVRLSVTNGGFPECYSTNGVNCKLTEHAYDLLPILTPHLFANASVSNNTAATASGSLTTDVITIPGGSNSIIPAPCGPLRKEHWGEIGLSESNSRSSGYWCFKAYALLANPMRPEELQTRIQCTATSFDQGFTALFFYPGGNRRLHSVGLRNMFNYIF
ncbi:hypothetical protein ACHHYP_01688 [Achlya hypogyna]|uniref:Beta/gamma crystallin 'Greek key' domain-containing protein n=1 Tax=Achlya hypogyna TaxID=1202772 RepID=A0A1V9Z7Y6_ACHHY|nr:hypothetical protein ACHHYP_01688 [Achlya hypogyna]